MSTTYKSNGNGIVNVASTGVAISLSTSSSLPNPGKSFPCNRVDIQARRGNSGNIMVGDSTVKNDDTAGGISLTAGQVYNVELISDLLSIYINGSAGDGVTFTWWIGDRV